MYNVLSLLPIVSYLILVGDYFFFVVVLYVFAVQILDCHLFQLVARMFH